VRVSTADEDEILDDGGVSGAHGGEDWMATVVRAPTRER
jgi:hypothetical protein